jgi:dTDP-4-amino-4,6-dideoxygalactose transaminase
MGENEKDYVTQAFDSNWVAPLGPNVDAFENQLSDYVGIKGAVSLSSGTAAIHLALLALGIKNSDVVLCQSFTFAATAFPISYVNAEPVFIDSEALTWNMDPELLENAISDSLNKGKKPAAIIVVHLYGMPANMDEIMRIANQHDIPVIEDAAEALGSSYKNQRCGSFGRIGILSFNGNKIITTSGGGALLSDNAKIIEKVRHLSAQAKEPVPYYLHKEIGYNYRMSNICAGIGRGQMEVLPERISKRREIFERYKEELGLIKGLSFLSESENYFSNRWLTTMLFDTSIHGEGKNELLRVHLEKLNIESRALWKPLHQQPVFKECKSYLNGVSDKLYSEGLCLPSGSNMSLETQKIVIKEIKEFLN